MDQQQCLFCGSAPRKGRKLCDVCLGLDNEAQVGAASQAFKRILEQPASAAKKAPARPKKPSKTGSGQRADPEPKPKPARKPAVQPKSTKKSKTKAKRTSSKSPAKRNSKSKKCSSKKELAICVQCNEDFERYKSNPVARCDSCRRENRAAELAAAREKVTPGHRHCAMETAYLSDKDRAVIQDKVREVLAGKKG